MHAWRGFFIGCLLLIGLGAAGAFAQTTELTGRVTDPGGKVVSGVTVRVAKTGTTLETETASNDAGYYFFSNVQPGEYTLTVSHPGFKLIRRSGITVATADKKRLDVQLELGAVTETVTVTADASQLQLDSPEMATTIGTREYERLPQIQFNRMRSPATFLYLSPGVHGNIQGNGRETVAASNVIRINGSRTTSNEMYMDGLPGRTNFNETAPPVDAVGEFKLQANQLSAEYGNTGSAVISFSIKSGTNDLHGLAFNILRNEKLDARSFLSPTRSTIRQNEFGATLGGPVWIPKLYDGRNKTFFFFAYTGSRKRGLDQTQRRRIATPAERTGDFSAQTRLIYDPNTTRTVGTAFARDPFPGNRIPANRLDPVAVKVSELLPAPNLSGAGVLNYQDFIGERLLDPDVYLTRIDHALSAKHRLFGTYNHTRIPRQNVTSAMAEPFSDRTFQFITSHMIRTNWDWAVSPSMLNTFLGGFNRFRNPFRGFYANQGYAERFGLKNVVGDAFPTFTFTDSYVALGRNGLSDATESLFILKDILSMTRGKQSFKFGAEYRQNRNWNTDASVSAGTYAFSNTATALPTALNTTGDGYASFLLGQVNSASISLPFTNESRKPYWGFFAQDDYRVSSRLTLNLGFRYEVTFAPYELDDQYSLIDLGTPNPAAGGRLGASVFAGDGPGRLGTRRLTKTHYDRVAPRLGFAYQVTPKTVLRGGYGLFYGDNGLGIVTTGFRTVRGFQSLDQGVTAPFLLRDGFPGALTPNVEIGPAVLNGQSVTARSETVGRNPRTQNWSLSLQRELSSNWALELNYVANKSTGLSSPSMINDNQVDPRFLSLGSLLTQQVTSAAAVAQGIPLPYPGFRGSVAQALRPYPQYLTVTEQSAKAGGSFYQSWVGRIRKRYSAGITLDAHYTFSRFLGTSDTATDHFNRGLEWSLQTADVPHALVLQYSYELPFGPGKRMLNGNGLARHLVGGWILNGIHRYQSGTPLAISMNNTLPIFSRALRPDVVAGVARDTGIGLGDFQPNSDRRVNPAAFRNPAPFTYGSSAAVYGDVRNFRVFSEDFSLLKNTTITERVTMELTAQFINALNRHRLTDLNANFTNPTFGQASGSSLGRLVTVGLKLKF